MKNKNYFYLLFGVLALIFVGLAGLLMLVKFRTSPSPIVPLPPATSNFTNISEEDELALQQKVALIIKTKDFRKCESVNSELYRKVCINNIALNLAKETGDISYCQMVDNELIPISECEREAIFDYSLQKEDITICNKTKNSELKRECYQNFWPRLAMKKKNPQLCENIVNQSEKNLCYDKYLFFTEFVKSPPNFSCIKFRDLGVREDCEIYKQSLKKRVSGNICEMFSTNLFKNYCFRFFK